MVSLPVRVPVAVGVKVTSTVQLDPSADVAGEAGQELLAGAKSPLVRMLFTFTGSER
jgi:hypothetical protein